MRRSRPVPPRRHLTATIIKIHPLASGKKFEAAFHRVEFQTKAGGWAKTDLCPKFRNFARWKPYLRVGARLTELRIDGTEIDADSDFRFVRFETVEKPKPIAPPADPQLDLL